MPYHKRKFFIIKLFIFLRKTFLFFFGKKLLNYGMFFMIWILMQYLLSGLLFLQNKISIILFLFQKVFFYFLLFMRVNKYFKIRKIIILAEIFYFLSSLLKVAVVYLNQNSNVFSPTGLIFNLKVSLDRPHQDAIKYKGLP